MKVLIVEDEREVAHLLRDALESLGGDCLLAEDAAAADRVVGAESLDALTLDLGLPDGEGIDWLERLATEFPDLARKTLVITGRCLEPDSVQRLQRCGAGILAKPFTLANLADAVRAQIDHGIRFSRN